ncbi:MAG: beta-ketoacyl-[acyl-carrier-protein] synthase family protein [Rubrivivax sp.]
MSGHAHRVVVTGVGVVSAHGLDARSMFSALMDGHSAISFNTVGAEPYSTNIASAACHAVQGSMPLGRSKVTTVDRVSHLSILAATAAWDDSGLGSLDDQARDGACVLIGTAVGGAQSTEHGYRELFVRQRPRLSPLTVVQCMHNAPAAHVAQHFNLGGTCFTYSVACASGAAAIVDAVRRIRGGECQLVLAGGTEAALPFGIVKAWQSMRVLAPAVDQASANRACRPFARDREGMSLGEGAAMLILEEREHAMARGARIVAELAGIGSSCDPGAITSTAAAGQLRAMRAALRDAGANPDEVAYVNAHGTAMADGDLVEIDALRQQFGAHASQLAVSATKSLHGHLLGASGAIEAAITAMAVNRGQIPPTGHDAEIDPGCMGVDHVLRIGREVGHLPLALSNCFAFGGSNVVLAFCPHA